MVLESYNLPVLWTAIDSEFWLRTRTMIAAASQAIDERNSPSGKQRQPRASTFEHNLEQFHANAWQSQRRIATRQCLKDPNTDKETLAGEGSSGLLDGFDTMYDEFLKLGTWIIWKLHEVYIGTGNNPLTTKKVYKTKLHAVTKDIRFRVRTGERGFDMIPGVHYDENFAPTTASEKVRIMFCIALWILQQSGVDHQTLARGESAFCILLV